LQANPSPQSVAVRQGSSHRGVQRFTIFVVQLVARSSAGATGSVQLVFGAQREGGAAGQSTVSCAAQTMWAPHSASVLHSAATQKYDVLGVQGLQSGAPSAHAMAGQTDAAV
jgi:hypothetical protein